MVVSVAAAAMDTQVKLFFFVLVAFGFARSEKRAPKGKDFDMQNVWFYAPKRYKETKTLQTEHGRYGSCNDIVPNEETECNVTSADV